LFSAVAVVGQRHVVGHLAAEGDRAEHRAGADLGSGKPRLDGLDGTEAAAAQDGHLGPLPFLVGLAAPDRDAEPVRRLGQVGDLEGAEDR
jgi:hypothetical protein